MDLRCPCFHIFLTFLKILVVLAMESQAEALGQLTADDLEGKVKVLFSLQIYFVLDFIAGLLNLKTENTGTILVRLPPNKHTQEQQRTQNTKK